jgi:ubiquitin-protein ligase
MTSTAVKRATKEFAKFQSEPLDGVLSVALQDDASVFKWLVVVRGPHGTPYADGKFQLLVELDEDYPNKPPSIKFLTKILHPRVDPDGKPCFTELMKDWSPTTTVKDILPLVLGLFYDLDGGAVMNEKAGAELAADRATFLKQAEKLTKQYAV